MDEKLLIRYINQDATDNEIKEVIEWFDKNPAEHLIELNRVRYALHGSDVYGTPVSPIRRIIKAVIGFAAVIMLMAGAWYASDWNTINQMTNRIVRLETPAGQRMTVTLEDGTSVQLNAGTVLEYPSVFAGSQRRVLLSGEAIFDVKHDKDRPFIVETFASEVEVLGTKFSVEADKESGRFSAMLMEGSVQVRSRFAPMQSITMQPHDRVDLIDGEFCKSRVPDFRELCWTEGIIYIKKMPFDDLMRRLERAYNVDISIERETLPKIEVRSGKIRISEGIEYALQMLQKVSDFRYRYDEEKNLIVIR